MHGAHRILVRRKQTGDRREEEAARPEKKTHNTTDHGSNVASCTHLETLASHHMQSVLLALRWRTHGYTRIAAPSLRAVKGGSQLTLLGLSSSRLWFCKLELQDGMSSKLQTTSCSNWPRKGIKSLRLRAALVSHEVGKSRRDLRKSDMGS